MPVHKLVYGILKRITEINLESQDKNQLAAGLEIIFGYMIDLV